VKSLTAKPSDGWQKLPREEGAEDEEPQQDDIGEDEDEDEEDEIDGGGEEGEELADVREEDETPSIFFSRGQEATIEVASTFRCFARPIGSPRKSRIER